jgi:mono/diheme cytochrome c family protein
MMLRRLSHKTAAILAAVAGLTVALAATVRAADDATGNPMQAQIDHGKSTYASKCSHCHGPNLMNSGTITPDLRAFPDDKTRFVTTVKNGKNNRMPPWGDILNDEEIGSLWAFISSRRKP